MSNKVTFDVFHERTRANLKGISRERKNSRKAYVSGIYIGLVMGLLHAEAGYPRLGEDFWKLFNDPHSQKLGLKEYIEKIIEMSGGVIKLTEEDFQNSGLRLGIPGSFYALGVMNALRVSVGFGSRKSEAWFTRQFEWLSALDQEVIK